ncbi:hypothetical protein GOBAR_DD22952 [Gossypium barbadense]|nr:hypothetical protein GOBAR_DD22952 [Gossypium barbadense]
MAACTYPWENISDPVMAKARACLQAIIMAEDMRFQDICIKGDKFKFQARTKEGQQSCSCDGEGSRALLASSILDRRGAAYSEDPEKSREEKRHSWRLNQEVEPGLCGVCLSEELAMLKETVAL